MGKTLKYVSEFSFPSDKGYSGSAGKQMVKGYARGGSCGYAKGGMKPMKKADGGAVDDPRRPLMDRTTRELIDAINAERRTMERSREALPFAISGAELEMMMSDPRVVMRLADMTRGPMSDAERMALLRPARGGISQGMRSPRAEMARERALMGEGYKKGGMAKGGKMDRLKGVTGNERKEMTRVEAKQRDAGQELSRVRSEMRYDKNEMKGMRKQYPVDRREPMIPMSGMAKGGMLYSKKEVNAKNLLGEGKAPPLPHAKDSVNIKRGGMAKGGMTGKQQAKIGKVMGEFKAGELHSGSKSGPVVKSRKQAIAIGLSEARAAKKK